MKNFYTFVSFFLLIFNFSNAQLNSANDTIMPQFICGDTTLKNYVILNTQYPKDAKNNCLRGEVSIGFKVTSEGKLKKFTFLKYKYGLLDEEALRVVYSTEGKWKPATVNGIPIDFNIKIDFNFWFDKFDCDRYVNDAYNHHYFSTIVKSEKSNVLCFNGKQKLESEDYENALNDFNESVETDEKYPVAFYYRGLCKLKLFDNEGACLDFKKANECFNKNIENEIYKEIEKLIESTCK